MTNKERFVDLYKTNIKRDGADGLLDWLESTTFFMDPASSKYHMAFPGGLCQHSLNVYDRLEKLVVNEFSVNTAYHMPTKESIAIVSLLHDLCKIGCYVTEPKNQKTYDPEKVAAAPKYQVKSDSLGEFIWETVMGYKHNDPLPYGHGEKSVWLIQKHMQLTDEEAFAIRYHMGSWNEAEKNNASVAFTTYPLAFMLHVADEYATFIDEKDM